MNRGRAQGLAALPPRRRAGPVSLWARIAVALAGAAACSDGGGEVPEAKATPKPAAAAPAPAPAPAAAQPYAYSAIGRRDPFRSTLSEMAEAAAHAPGRAREETEAFELDQYRLIGLITGTSRPKAMVEDPTGRGHVLHIGSRLGRNGGRLTQIAPTAVTVVEETRDAMGRRVRLPVTLQLPPSELDHATPR